MCSGVDLMPSEVPHVAVYPLDSDMGCWARKM